MSETKKPTRVVAIAEAGPTQQQITAALSSQPEFQLVTVLPTLDRVAQEIRAADPEIVVIDDQIGNQSTLDSMDALALDYPQVALVAILPADDLVSAQQVMLAGVRAFLTRPFTDVALLSSLRRVKDLEARRRHSPATAAVQTQDRPDPLRLLTVYSPRGGVGCSTIAINLAIALREEASERVLLLEGKLPFGHLGMMLNVRVPNTLADLIPHAAGMDDGLVREVVAEHASGIHVLLGPSSVEVAQGIRPEHLFSIVRTVRRMYDFVVIDAGSSLNENSVTLMDSADRVLLVTTPDLAALHDTSRFVQVSRSLAYPPGKILLILNRAGMPGGVRIGDIQNAVHQELFAQIPDDGPIALRSLNRGIPVLLKYPRSPVSRAIQRLARNLAQVGTEQTTRATAGAAASKVKARWGAVRAG